MDKARKLLALLLAVLLTVLPGCAEQKAVSDRVGDPAGKTEATTPLQPAPSPSPDALRQEMEGTGQLFAVASLGYQLPLDGTPPVDPYTVMEEYASGLCREYPFLREIPAERIVGEMGDLLCVIPVDEDATVAVSRGYWDEENMQYIYDDLIYSSDTGEPFFLLCNTAWEPDTLVYISGPSGEAYWYPMEGDDRCIMPLRSGERDLIRDISPYRELLVKRHRDMESEWILPSRELLVGSTWSWSGFLKDGRDVLYQVTFDEQTLSAVWIEDIDEEPHEFPDAAWELSYEDGFAVLTIDFREMAGILRYDLMYQEDYGTLYVAMDVTAEAFSPGGEPLYRFLNRPYAPEPTELIGSWELAWTEVEGYVSDEEQGTRWIEIFSAASGDLLMSYSVPDRPDHSFYDERLIIDMRELHHDCGNDVWTADVDCVGPWDTTYAITLRADDILIKQNYFLLDGAPTVSYEYYRRIGGGNEEDPYAYALSQGWREPELSELADTFWVSAFCGYALELMEDSDPHNAGGWAMLYDVDGEGWHDLSCTGSWQLAEGELHLTLTPVKGNGTPVDDSFPVLTLDGQLWIGRSGSGLGLPHFYSDTSADVLDRSEG